MRESMDNAKKVVVLGGTGFLGKHVMQRLAAQGHTAIALSRANGTDLRDLGALSAQLRTVQPDVILNCAAHVGSLHYVTTFAAEVVSDNLLMLVNLYRAAQATAPNALIVNPISNCSYPGAADIHTENEWEMGAVHDSVLAYGAPRRMIFAIAESYRKQYGTRSVNWLVSNAYGPGDHLDPNKVHALNGIIIRLIQARRRGDQTFVLWGTGKPLREWVYIEDVAKMLVQSAELATPQVRPVNLAQNKAWSIAEIAEMAAATMQYPVQLVCDTSKPDGAPVKILDDKLFRSQWPEFAFTPLHSGIANTIAYYENALD